MSFGAGDAVGAVEEWFLSGAGFGLKLVAGDVGLYGFQGDIVSFEEEFAGVESSDVGDEDRGVAGEVGEDDELTRGAAGALDSVEDWRGLVAGCGG